MALKRGFRAMLASRMGWLALAALLVGCSSSSSDPRDARADRGSVDAAPGDAGVDGPAAPDAAPADAPTPDGPRPPAHWELTSGPAPLVEDHEAVLLKDGRVLIIGGTRIPPGGGANDRVTLKETWLYQPDKNAFVAAGELNVAREGHTATLLDDGRVLVTGGASPQAYEASTELFDPTQAAASAWTVGPTMPQSRWHHSAVKLTGGDVLVTGGFASSDSSVTAWLYDAKGQQWKGLAAVMGEPRRGHATLVVRAQAGADRVLIVGGLQGSSPPSYAYSNTLEVYDQAKSVFALLPLTMSKKRAFPRLALLPRSRVLIVGGYCGQGCDADKELHDVYDPQLDTLTGIAHMGPYPHIAVALAMLPDGRAVLLSSETDPGKAVAFDFESGGTWAALPDLLVAQFRVSATTLADGSVLVVGGLTSTSPYTFADQAERLYP